MKPTSLRSHLSISAAFALLIISGTLSRAGINVTIGGTDPGSGYGVKSSVVGATTVDFNNVVLASQTTAYGSGLANFSNLTAAAGGSIVQLDSDAQYKTPVGDTSNFLSVGGGRSTSVTVDFATGISYFGLYWGTADSYNSLTFYAQDLVTVIATITPGSTPGVTTQTQDSIYYNFTLAPADAPIGRIVFASATAAFEMDNLAFVAVPEPSTWATLSVVGTLLVVFRRRHSTI